MVNFRPFGIDPSVVDRKRRIKELEQELALLKAADLLEQGDNYESFVEHVRHLKKAGHPHEASCFYRYHCGCTVHEAMEFVKSLK